MIKQNGTLLTFDIGSSSVRALLFDTSVQPVLGALSSREHFLEHPEPGASVADARTLRGLVETCIDDLLIHPRARDIIAVGGAMFADTLVGLDERGAPITPVYTYADVRAASVLPQLRAQIDADAVHQRTGCVLHPAHRPAKLFWLRQTDPELFADVREWVDFATYLYRAWFGTARTSYSLAAWSGLLDRATLTWDEPLTDLLQIDRGHLAALADMSDSFRGLRGAYRNRWAALADVPFFLPVGDGAAANVGAGAVGADRIALTVGTTAALRRVIHSDTSSLPRGIFGYRVNADHHLIGGATSEGGNVYAWARETLRLPEDAEAQLQTRPADSHGLTLLPLLAGERSPGYAMNAVGAITGLRLNTTPLDILHAALEGVALRLALILDRLETERDAIIYAGGGAIRQSEAWTQIIANALDHTLYMVDSEEMTARGAAILMLSALYDEPLEHTARERCPVVVERVVSPRWDAARALRAARDRQVALYEKVIPRS